MSEFTQDFKACMAANGLSEYAGDSEAVIFERLTGLLLAYNEKVNLTAVTDTHQIIMRHYVDSLSAARLIPKNCVVIDVGCGAGFPTLPLAIVRKDLTLTALDGTLKKLKFVEEAAAELNLTNVSIEHGRAEELARIAGHRLYGAAISRAVAPLDKLCGYCLPLLKSGGLFLAMKSASQEEEIEVGKAAAKKYGCADLKFEPLTLTDPKTGETFAHGMIIGKKK